MMAIWKSWYRGNVNDFHYFQMKMADGTTKQCERLTMNIPKKVCEDFAKLLWSEKVQIKLDKNESLLSDKYVGMLTNVDAILVDEAQFLTTSQVEDLWIIAKTKNISVICFGLKTNFKSEFFEGSKRLFELADKFKELETICSCGVKARFNARKVNGKFILDGDEFVIDGDNKSVKYVPLCSKCYLR